MASPSSASSDFKDRVAQIFGSLAPSSQQQTPLNNNQQKQPPSLWSLSGDQVERKKWLPNELDDDEDDDVGQEEERAMTSSNRKMKKKRTGWLKQCEADLDALDDDDDDDDDQEQDGSNREGDEEWEIRNSISKDPTLDREDEEDEFDKVASGRGYIYDRLYMSDVKDEGSYLNSKNVFSGRLHCITKDPRANRSAAEIRLREDDAEAAEGFVSPNREEQKPQPKSILKRKSFEKIEESKLQKRVKFDPSCVSHENEESTQNNFQGFSVDTTSENAEVFLPTGYPTLVPDYIQNPSRYTRYSFDSTSEVDMKSNTQAFTEFLKGVNSSDSTEPGTKREDGLAEVPKLPFNPMKKAGDVQTLDNNTANNEHIKNGSGHTVDQTGFPVGLADTETQQADVKEEDEPDTRDKNGSVGKPGRRYRTKSRSDDSDSG